MHTCCLRMCRGRARRDVSRAESYGSHHDHSPAHCLMAQRSISGRPVDVLLTPDQLDALLDALDNVHACPYHGWDKHQVLRAHLSVAYNESQGVQ